MASGQVADDLADGFAATTPKRPKSSVLKSFMHRRNESKRAGLTPSKPTDLCIITQHQTSSSYVSPVSPPEYLHTRPLEELAGNNQNVSPKKSRDLKRPTTGDSENRQHNSGKALHKKTFSTYSLKSLALKDDDKKSKDEKVKPKKTKSTTNLGNFLSRPKSSRTLSKDTIDSPQRPRDKENTTPSGSAPELLWETTPIYAQFASQPLASSPLGGKFFENESDLGYFPDQNTPRKQRSFYDGTSSAKPSMDQQRRPLSEYLQPRTSMHDIKQRFMVTRSSSDDTVRPSLIKRSSEKSHMSQVSQMSQEYEKKAAETKAAPLPKPEPTFIKPEVPSAKRGSRVMAAVAKFSSKDKNPPAETEPQERKPENDFSSLNGRDLESELESMLDFMNIPADQRRGMRELDASVKRQLIRQHHVKQAEAQLIRPTSKGSMHDSACHLDGSVPDEEPKSKRRSRTFTLSRGSKDKDKNKDKDSDSSHSRKHRPESMTRGHVRNKSNESTISTRSFASTTSSVASSLIAKAKGQQLPEDFVAYLKKVQKPEQVEVGKLHKLRLLLRNETVVWTDTFVGLGGMKEIVGLLHRIMDIEWREEHEDLLLHETLLCLKALCTTALALQYLSEIQTTLFPAIIHMLFDPEKKGPSEFTTRNIITSLLFIYLKSATPEQRADRARTLLSYLRDPQPKEEERPVGFVLEMRRERPYRVWCTEVVNVSKEVFWIFLHQLNVITATPTNLASIQANPFNYMNIHFPTERPPVPAAPYVGGVEWDATNYIASHLDILNAIIASLPSSSERNELRAALRLSGWEKGMGGTLRTCKEKFYGSVHAGLRCWASAALADGWDTEYVRCGTGGPSQPPSPTKPSSPIKKDNKKEGPPKLEIPPIVSSGASKPIDDGWL